MVKEITLEELKDLIYTSWYSKRHQKQYDISWGEGKAKEDIKNRTLIIKEVEDCYGTVSSIFFSINGSPPKGRALLINNHGYQDPWSGDLLIIGRQNKWINNVKVIR